LRAGSFRQVKLLILRQQSPGKRRQRDSLLRGGPVFLLDDLCLLAQHESLETWSSAQKEVPNDLFPFSAGGVWAEQTI
jgi:hypothetical protein